MPNEPVEGAARPKVLMVDDEAPNLRTFRRAFGTEFEVFTAESKDAALEVIAKFHVDVVITDFQMPSGNGAELAADVKARAPDVPVIMVTGYPDLPEVIRAHREGLVSTVIIKPWEREDVQRWVDQLLRLRSMRRAVAKLSSSNSQG